jgi:hypothetical protein
MPGVRSKAIILVIMAIIVASGSVGAAYACYDTPYYPPFPPVKPQQLDLKICDQDETWGDGVRETWTAGNMAPGDEFAFDGHFVGLRAQFPRRVDDGLLDITCAYNPWTPAQPDRMAKYMVITRCVYNYADKFGARTIDCLTGKATRPFWTWFPIADNDWKIQDVDRDGRITFYDLRKRPLKDLPSFPDDEASFEMSVRFHSDAGNEFQGDTLTLTMIYTLRAG